MRVLVTGAGGYIGSVATERLIERGNDVVALDSFLRGHRSAIHPAAETLTCDLRDPSATRQAVLDARVDAVLHFAALHLVPESVERPAEYYETNVGGGINLLSAVKESGIHSFVFSSTAAVYGEPTELPITEDAPKRPINPYGHSKWIVEQILAQYGKAYDINYAAFRYFNVAGASATRGEDHDPETHVIPVALQAIMGKRERFTVFGTDYDTDDGTAVRDYVHVIDLVDAHIAALDLLQERSLGAINLGTRDGFSVANIVDAVQGVTDRELPVAYGPRRAGDPPALIADASRAQQILGWKPVHSTMEQMIGSAWDWTQAHPEGYRD